MVVGKKVFWEKYQSGNTISENGGVPNITYRLAFFYQLKDRNFQSTLAKKLTHFWPWKERFPWDTFSTQLWQSFRSTFDLFIAYFSVKGTGGRLCLRFIGTWFADTGRWRRFTIFWFPGCRYDVNHQYQTTAKQVSCSMSGRLSEHSSIGFFV